MKKIILSVLIIAALSLLADCATAMSLVDAVLKGDINTVRALLDSGADVNATDDLGRHVLEFATWGGNVAVVKLLVERGADLDLGISSCEKAIEWGKANWNNSVLDRGNRCANMLRRIKAEWEQAKRQEQETARRLRAEREEAKRQEQETARAQALEAQRAQQMKAMLQEVLAAASKGQREQTKSAAVRSDIDKPEFAESERIMGDDDLAVIIGIEGYQSLPKSDYSYDDAKLVKEYVKALGFKERNIELVLDERATKSSIEKTVEAWLKNKAKPDSRVFIYYSGHGAPEPSTGDAYLVPFDGDPNYLSTTGYSLKRLYANLGKLEVKEVVVALDACFSGAGGRSVLAHGARPLVMMTSSLVLPQNIAVLSATQGTQISTSSSEKGHGVFTYYFLKALKDGKKDIAEIYSYIKPLVEDEAKQINVQQSPSISPDVENLKGKFSLRK